MKKFLFLQTKKKPMKRERCRQPRTFERYQIDNNVIRMMYQHNTYPIQMTDEIRSGKNDCFEVLHAFYVRWVARRSLKYCEFDWVHKEIMNMEPCISIIGRVQQENMSGFTTKIDLILANYSFVHKIMRHTEFCDLHTYPTAYIHLLVFIFTFTLCWRIF